MAINRNKSAKYEKSAHKKITPYLLPSIADIFFAILLVVLSLNVGQKLLNDCDTGYHIRAGEYILETWSIPKVDMFSLLDPPPPGRHTNGFLKLSWPRPITPKV